MTRKRSHGSKHLHKTTRLGLSILLFGSLLHACSNETHSDESSTDISRNPNSTDAASPSDTGNEPPLQDDAGVNADAGETPMATYVHPDRNNNGQINILILGTSSSLSGGPGFSADQIATELKNILEGDSEIVETVNVVSEDIYASKPVTFGLGGNGSEYTLPHYRHSLTQYLYWPEDAQARVDNLQGKDAVEWDYVVIGADPYIVSNMPGYFALGAHKLSAKISEGSAQPLLLMMWSDDLSKTERFEEIVYRTADGAPVELPVVPAGLAWAELSTNQRDSSQNHPSPNGAYLAAASIYSQITETSAANSSYQYPVELAVVAFSAVNQAKTNNHYSGDFENQSPFGRCKVETSTLTYNHTGTSSERGILDGLNWIFNQATEDLQRGNSSPMTFNYGRANTNFEPNKRYKIDPTRFQYSFGFPMQDHGNHGDVSMLYGLDERDGGVVNDTDLGVARFMIEQSELPHGRAIPIRTLYAQMKEATPNQSAYRDAWHMHRDLDKSIGAFMYTLLTNKCSLGGEPSDSSSREWRTWKAHKIGCDTAWTLMYLEKSPF
ncbi:MAG: hypothetical protein VYC39_16265 [Myxococcota bacterium]|nr:hypothetical protein [Myxococcota bacterium]